MKISLNSLSLYWHTLKHLRLVQIYRRFWFRIAKTSLDLTAAPPLRKFSGKWCGAAARHPSMIGPENFVFLDVQGSLINDGWDNPALPKLWRYNQHYFDDLNAHSAFERRDWHHDLIGRWIADNAFGKGSGWEPYPLSLRLVNWIKFAHAGETLSDSALHSMAVQARWLIKRIEWHLLGNHLLANAKALMFAGLFFDGPEADHWRKIAARILIDEISEQFLPDGGQFELSPMYHAIALEDLLDLVNLWCTYEDALTRQEKTLLRKCRDVIPCMQHWLAVMTHPDEQISFFNDAAFGIAPETAELCSLAQRLGFTNAPALDNSQVTQLKESGYTRLERGPAILIADVAAIGPDYLPGHAHADTLSFELSVFGHRVLVNSGTSEYGTGIERHRQRSTPAHNTVTVAGQNSSEVWSGFRVARRAVVRSTTCEGTRLEAWHDGYLRLSPPTEHRRVWDLKQNELIVTDMIDSKQSGEAYFHFHPSVQVIQTGANCGEIRLPLGKNLQFKSTSLTAKIKESTWHPFFGKSLKNRCLVAPLTQGRHMFHLFW